MTAHNGERRFQLAADVRWRVVDGEVVIVLQRRGEVVGLNGTASFAFQRAADGATLSAIVDEILDDVDAARDDVERDVRELFDGLARDGIVTVAP